jgi:hypothetical protein
MPRKIPLGSEALTVTNAVKQLTATVYNTSEAGATSGSEYALVSGHKANSAVLEVLTESIWYTTDGSTPTTSNGHELAAGDTLILDTYGVIAALKMYRATGSDSTIYITYYKG